MADLYQLSTKEINKMFTDAGWSTIKDSKEELTFVKGQNRILACKAGIYHTYTQFGKNKSTIRTIRTKWTYANEKRVKSYDNLRENTCFVADSIKDIKIHLIDMSK